MMKVVIAIDSFKGCISSVQANKAAAQGVLEAAPQAQVASVPVSDGGEGWLEAFQTAVGGQMIEVDAMDPMAHPIKAQYLIHDDTAVIEIARASGLTLLAPEERNALAATSYGTGMLVVDAVRRGCRRIIVGLGGSATSDCGLGMLRAIHKAFAPHGTWRDIRALDGVHFTIATDVSNPLCGPCGAARVFAPQKGASPVIVERIEERAVRFAATSARYFGYDRQYEKGAGAAGGLGYAFLQYMNAECRSGIDLLLDYAQFDALLSDASLVITGEGTADRQTLMGKLPWGILKKAKATGVPVALVAGQVADRQQLLQAGFSRVECINPPHLPLAQAMLPVVAMANVSATVRNMIL